MKALTYSNPFGNWRTCNIRLSSVLGRQTHRRSDDDKESITVAEWAPVVDIIENKTEYLIKVDLPEIKREEIKVTAKKTAYSFFLASVSLKGRKKAENITVFSGPMGALGAVSAYLTMRMPRR
jgi:hypothetical protein